ncbi:MAG: hypothetical protein ACKO23_02285 [Gemmataceae bacterium]
MYPHRMRLRGPWSYQPLARDGGSLEPLPPPGRITMPARWSDVGLRDFHGKVGFHRDFGYPGRIDDWERVWLTIASVAGRAMVRLNETELTSEPFEGDWQVDITRQLRPRNQLVIEVEGNASGGLPGEVALEVRAQAYLGPVRFHRENRHLRAQGTVRGESADDLDLYLLCGRHTLQHGSIRPFVGSASFQLSGEITQTNDADIETVRVELVRGALVWYSLEASLPGDNS